MSAPTIEERLAALEAEAESLRAEAEAAKQALADRVTRKPSGIACQVPEAEARAAWDRTHLESDPWPGPCQAVHGSDNAYAHLDAWANVPDGPPDPSAKRTRRTRTRRTGHQYVSPDRAKLNADVREYRGTAIAQALISRAK